MDQTPAPAVGQIWASRFTTGLRVAVTEVDGRRVRTADIDPGTGRPRARGRWGAAANLIQAYTLIEEPGVES